MGGEFGYTFKCTSHRGAYLVLKDYATKASFGPNAPFEKYMLQHHASWYAYATDDSKLGIRIAKEELVLVRGTMKTSSWTVGAFLGRVDRTQEGTIGAQSTAAVGANFSLSSEYSDYHNCEQRSSPQSPSPPESADVEPSDNLQVENRLGALAKNQCIFLNIYKLKHRKLLPTKIVANGEPSDPDHQDDDSLGSAGTSVSSADYSIEMDPGNVPVSVLCDMHRFSLP